MSIANSEASSSSSARARARARDTGFPESFCGSESLSPSRSLAPQRLTNLPPIDRNTSLPHPDADTSPNASISQDDIAVSRALSRHRRSFLVGKMRRNVSHGRITAEMEQMYSDVSVNPDLDASPTLLPSAQLATISDQRPSSGGADSFHSTSTGDADHDDSAPKSPRHSSRKQRLSSDSVGSTRRHRRSLLEVIGLRRLHE